MFLICFRFVKFQRLPYTYIRKGSCPDLNARLVTAGREVESKKKFVEEPPELFRRVSALGLGGR